MSFFRHYQHVWWHPSFTNQFGPDYMYTASWPESGFSWLYLYGQSSQTSLYFGKFLMSIVYSSLGYGSKMVSVQLQIIETVLANLLDNIHFDPCNITSNTSFCSHAISSICSRLVSNPSMRLIDSNSHLSPYIGFFKTMRHLTAGKVRQPLTFR